MKVLLINGSPRKEGNTYLALSEVASALQANGVDTEIVSIGAKAVQDAEALRQQGISWIAAGKDETDLTQAVEILSKEFGVERLAVVGGGIINGAFLKAGLLDEVSVVVGAGIDGRKGMTAVFDGIDDPSFPTTILKLNSVERIGDNSVWLRYSF